MKNKPENIDLRGFLKTADHCGAVSLFDLNSLTYAFCSANHFHGRTELFSKRTQKHRFTTGGKPSTWFPPEGLVEQKLKNGVRT